MGARVLGRPALVGTAGTCQLRGARQLGLLALLAANHGRPVRRAVIEDELWAGEPVSDAAARVAVKRLRSRFVEVTGTDPLSGDPSGYVLDLGPEGLDSLRYDGLVAQGRATLATGGAARALTMLSEADGMWAGAAFEGAQDLPSVRTEHLRLEALRQEAR